MSLLSTRSVVHRAVAQRSFATLSKVGAIPIAAVDNGSSTSSLTVVLKAGSQYESVPGQAAVAKQAFFKDNAGGTALSTTRYIEFWGGIASTTLTRETLSLTTEFVRGNDAPFAKLLTQIVSPVFAPHDYKETAIKAASEEAAYIGADPSSTLIEEAHHVAFRTGLGNSVILTPTAPVSYSEVAAFLSSTLSPLKESQGIAVIGTGMSIETLTKHVEAIKVNGEKILDAELITEGEKASTSVSTEAPAVKYYGGESRLPIDLHLLPAIQPTLVIAYGSTTPSPDLAVLPYIFGTAGPSIKWSTGQSALGLAAAKVDPDASASAFAYTYSKAALVGVELKAPGSKRLGELGVEAVKLIKNFKVTEETLKSAIAKAKFDAASKVDTSVGATAAIASTIFTGKVPTIEETFAALDKVTVDSLTKAATTLFKSKPTVVSMAKQTELPYADELGL